MDSMPDISSVKPLASEQEATQAQPKAEFNTPRDEKADSVLTPASLLVPPPALIPTSKKTSYLLGYLVIFAVLALIAGLVYLWLAGNLMLTVSRLSQTVSQGNLIVAKNVLKGAQVVTDEILTQTDHALSLSKNHWRSFGTRQQQVFQTQWSYLIVGRQLTVRELAGAWSTLRTGWWSTENWFRAGQTETVLIANNSWHQAQSNLLNQYQNKIAAGQWLMAGTQKLVAFKQQQSRLAKQRVLAYAANVSRLTPRNWLPFKSTDVSLGIATLWSDWSKGITHTALLFGQKFVAHQWVPVLDLKNSAFHLAQNTFNNRHWLGLLWQRTDHQLKTIALNFWSGSVAGGRLTAINLAWLVQQSQDFWSRGWSKATQATELAWSQAGALRSKLNLRTLADRLNSVATSSQSSLTVKHPDSDYHQLNMAAVASDNSSAVVNLASLNSYFVKPYFVSLLLSAYHENILVIREPINTVLAWLGTGASQATDSVLLAWNSFYQNLSTLGFGTDNVTREELKQEILAELNQQQTATTTVTDSNGQQMFSGTGIVVMKPTGSTTIDLQNVQKLESAFSDRVLVNFSDDGTSGVIQPVFGTKVGQKYLFVITPIKQ